MFGDILCQSENIYLQQVMFILGTHTHIIKHKQLCSLSSSLTLYLSLHKLSTILE